MEKDGKERKKRMEDKEKREGSEQNLKINRIST